MLRRFGYWRDAGVVESTRGEYVLYSDYQKLEGALKEALDELDAATTWVDDGKTQLEFLRRIAELKKLLGTSDLAS